MKIKQMIILLRFYDLKKFCSFCCADHAIQFDLKTDQIKIMEPPLNEVINYLMLITQLIIEDSAREHPENSTLLITVLNLDFSPCIVKGVFTVIIVIDLYYFRISLGI